ncbi:MAG: hypothetical protein ACE5H1_11450, partial [Thermodesulfobacteriota bacterium]
KKEKNKHYGYPINILLSPHYWSVLPQFVDHTKLLVVPNFNKYYDLSMQLHDNDEVMNRSA